MGYYTEYEIESDLSANTIAEELKNISGYKYYTSESDDLIWTDSIKWYDWETDMITLSHRYPNTTFIVTRIGEENGDYWKARIKNGKVDKVRGEIVYPPFPGNE